MFHLIVNQKARSAAKSMDKVFERFRAEGVPFDIHFGESKEGVRALVRSLTEGEETVQLVAVGGDGTLNDVLCGICDPSRAVLGLVPLGTGNDFARAAKIPEGVASLDLIFGTEPKETDYIECGGERSMNIAGLGIDVDLLERCNRMKRGGRKGKYFRSLLASLATYRGQRVEVEVNGETFSVNALIAAVCNGTHLGGGIPLCPPAVVDDGKLELVVVECPARWRIPFALIKLMRGKIFSLPFAKRYTCEEVRVVQVEGKTVQLDGELVSMRTLSAHVVHGALKMYRG